MRLLGILLVTTLAQQCLTFQVHHSHQLQPSNEAQLAVARLTTTRTTNTRLGAQQEDESSDSDRRGNPLSFIMNPYESKIPKEIEADIYAAEGRTQAAQDRTQRIILYVIVAFTGVLGAFFNGFLSEIRQDVTLQEAGFGWVEDSFFVVRFLLMNKLGGGAMLLMGLGAGLLAEAEYDTRRINAEKIFAEMQKRREAKEQGGGGGGKSRKKQQAKKNKKRQSGRERKRLGALAEIVEVESASSQDITEDSTTTEAATTSETSESKEAGKEDGILGKIKGFYDRADSMAASQALLLNKKLEDEGLIEKITDESGLKVIGKDAAAKLKNEAGELEEEEKTTKA